MPRLPTVLAVTCLVCHAVGGVAADQLPALPGAEGFDRFTMQWCLFGEALHDSTHYKKQRHAMLMSVRKIKGNISIHHNLLFSSRDRHPTLGRRITVSMRETPTIATASSPTDTRTSSTTSLKRPTGGRACQPMARERPGRPASVRSRQARLRRRHRE